MTVRIPMATLIVSALLCLPMILVAAGFRTVEGDTVRVPDSIQTVEDQRPPDASLEVSPDSVRQETRQLPRPLGLARLPRFSGFDTLVAYFTSPRLNQRDFVARSYHYDAGDYFRFDPSFVVLDYIITPMRKTVKPCGLSGNHLGVLANDMPLQPFDHTPEPDGLLDMDDIPTALDNDIFLLPGALGTVFGSRHNAATLLTRPIRPIPRETHSALLVDKGTYGLSYARSRYSRGFANGRAIDMGIAYRFGDYYGTATDDNAYAYDGDFVLPLRERLGLRATGHLYKRDGFLAVANRDSSEVTLTKRDRFDRTARLLIESFGSDGKSRTSFGYTHLRQGSYLGPDQAGDLYKGRFNITGHGIVGSRQWLRGNSVVAISGGANREEYDNGRGNYVRYLADLSIVRALPFDTNQFAVTAGARSVERFGFMPSVAFVWKRESNRCLWLGTIGYSEREPSLHELHLPVARALIYGANDSGYAESGNASLGRERQIVASLRAEKGPIGNVIAASVIGGRIWNAIDWRPTLDQQFNTLVFSPVNDDMTFVTGTLAKDIQLGRLLNFHGGASYHYVDYASGRSKAYQPDYQAFGGAEFHIFWKQKLIHLFAYGEAVYLGPFDGYRKTGLGQTVVFNTKLSFSMGSFRFHLVDENVLNTLYENREFSAMPGRTLFWGFVWNFLD